MDENPDGPGPEDIVAELVRPCDWCDARGEWICVHCNLALCEDCMKEHKKEHPRIDEH